jgi:hypothetical protein
MENDMNTTKTLALAALAALSLGIGSAMAQEGGSMPVNFYGVVNAPTASHKVADPRIQAGSSDVDAVRSGAHVLPFNRDHGDLANPG